jgi:hypothetical protein
MPSYPPTIRRCQHIKVNGTQCGSPALRDKKYCHFHTQWRQKSLEINLSAQRERWNVTLPMLEDADSVQMGLVEVMRLMVTQQIDHRTAALMLYALQTASSNLKRTSFEPHMPTMVVIDHESVERRPIGTTDWSTVAGREYDEVENDDEEKDASDKKDGRCGADLLRLIDLVVFDPELRQKRANDLRAKQEEELSRAQALL